MRRILLFGLIAAMIAASAALVSPNIASTTALCEDEPKAGLCQHETSFNGFGVSKFENAAGTISCLTFVSGYGEPATPKGSSLEGEMNFEIFNCARETGKIEFCWATEPVESLATFDWTSGADGTVTLTGSGGGLEINLFCQFKTNCTYTLESDLELNGGENGTLVANKAKMGSATGSDCPGAGAAISWTGTYEVGTIFVGETVPPVTLCKKSESPCPAEESYGVPTSLSASLESGGTAKLKLKITEESKTTEYTVACASSTLEGKTTAAGWPTKVGGISAAFGECGGTCAAEAIKGPFSGSVEASGSGNGKLSWSFRLQVRCIGAYKCTYEAGNLTSTITGGTPAKMPVAVSLSKLVAGESDAKCGAALTWEGAYRFTKPEAGGEAKMWVVREGI